MLTSVCVNAKKFLLLAPLPIMMCVATATTAQATAVRPAPNKVYGTPDKPYINSGAYKWMDTRLGDPSGSIIQNAEISVGFRAMDLVRNYGPITIRDTTFKHLYKTPVGTIPVAINAEYVHDLLIERTTSRDFQSKDSNGKYFNGDCFSSEGNSNRITYRDTFAINCANGGYDDKAKNVLYDRATAEGSDYGFRNWWNNTRATTITSINPRKIHLQMMTRHDKVTGKALEHIFEIDTLVIRDTVNRTIASLEPGSTLIIHKCEIHMPAPIPGVEPRPFWKGLNGGKASNVIVKLGPTCVDEKGITVLASEKKNIVLVKKLVDGNNDGKVQLTDKTADSLKLSHGTVLVFVGGSAGKWVYSIK